ncbi:SDR family NAD(P)-dependent oxidoreductase [Kiloniella sp. b19]|uniref:SDR family NAD(P)-dependent oxidoreductase n=1 Tax=Kiloniella sp. GXU_MW_B19 TaxID=3141326 RepID=UPI0031DC95A6
MTEKKPKIILITGGSSGIGEALALHYAAPGQTLFLTGRDQERLNSVCRACENKGATACGFTVSAGDREAMEQLINELDRQTPLDLVVANAGISGGTGSHSRTPGVENPEQTREILDINVSGVMNTILPAIPLMVSRQQGQLAIVSSLAGFKGLPTAPAYCASKAAVRVWGEGLRLSLARHNIRVSVITPGFVVSRITAVNRFKMPFLMEADEAAGRIASGLERNKSRIAFPWPMYSASLLMSWLPLGLSEWIGKKLPAKD